MKITIIIPVYNLEQYVRTTIVSALNQQFDGELEVIAVDDGSSDNSLLVMQNLAGQDTRLHVISQKNAGVSVARNTGIENATGDYVSFLDGDDILNPNAIHLLLASMQVADVTLASAGQVRINSQSQDISGNRDEYIIREADLVLADILSEKFDISACAKLYIREKIGELRFCPGKRVNEDKYFLFQYLLKNGGKVVCLKEKIYGYYIRSGSVTNSPYSGKILDMLYFSNEIEKDINEHKPKLITLAKYNNVVTHLALLKKIIRSGVKKEQKQLYRDIRKKILCMAREIGRKNFVKHTWEVLILKFIPWLYPPCVHVHDVIMERRR